MAVMAVIQHLLLHALPRVRLRLIDFRQLGPERGEYGQDAISLPSLPPLPQARRAAHARQRGTVRRAHRGELRSRQQAKRETDAHLYFSHPRFRLRPYRRGGSNLATQQPGNRYRSRSSSQTQESLTRARARPGGIGKTPANAIRLNRCRPHAEIQSLKLEFRNQNLPRKDLT